MYNLLIVDDEYLIREGLRKIIDWNKYDIDVVAVATNGAEALGQIPIVRPEIIITDIKMPMMGGLELIDNINRAYPWIKVIVISGYDDFEFVKKSMLYGVENYILKPVNENELITTLIGTTQKIESEFNEKVVTLQDLDIIKDNMFCSLIYNNFELNRIKSKFAMMGYHFESGHYYVAVIKLLEHAKHSEAEIVSIKQDFLRNITKSVVSLHPIYAFFDYSGNLVLILFQNDASNNMELLYPSLTSFIEYSRHVKNVDIFLTIGNSTDSIYTISSSYNNAVALQDYLYITPPNTVLSFDNIKMNKETPSCELSVNFKELSKLILNCRLDDIDFFFAGLSKKVLHLENISLDYLRSVSMDIIVELSRIIKSQGINTDKIVQNYSSYYSDFTSIKTFQDSLRWAWDTSIAAAKAILVQKEQPQNLIQRIIRHVDENFTKDLSIKSLGIEFNVTPNYIGLLFKQEKGRHFVDYIRYLRIEKAKELLRNTNLKANEIALKVGYVDADYFYKTFKKYEGISPTEYKQL